MTASRLAATLRALGRSGAGRDLILAEAAQHLEAGLGAAQAVLVRLDPDTGGFGGHYQRRPTAADVARSEAYVRERLDEPDSRTRGLRAAVSRRKPEVWLRNSCDPGWGLFDLDHYAQHYRDKGIGQLLSVMLASPAGGGGYICLYRSSGERAFTRAEEAAVAAIRAPLLHLYDAGRAAETLADEREDRAAILVRADRSLEASGRGSRLLGLLGGGGRDGERTGEEAVRRLLGKLERLGERDVLPSARIVNGLGTFDLRAEFLPSGAIVEIERRVPRGILALRGVERFDLSGRQIELAAELARGRTLQQASEVLGVSRSTAKYFLEEIFAKAAANDQTGALAALVEAGRPS